MANQTVTQPTIKIQIERRGHFYYYTREWGDDTKMEQISRERAETVIRAQSGGELPKGVNLDVVKPRAWTWQTELTE